MSIYKFKSSDLIYNRIKTYPKQDIIIYDGKVYINNDKNSAVTNYAGNTINVNNVKQGYISLYELNVTNDINTAGTPPAGGTSIYPFVTKDGARTAFKSISTSVFDSTSQYAYGDTIKGAYPLSASIKRTRFAETTNSTVDVTHQEEGGSYTQPVLNKKYLLSLKSIFNNYGQLSKHYYFNKQSIPSHLGGLVDWDKSNQEMSLIEIPSIFYGSSIRKGSVKLKFYVSGTLAAQLTDSHLNGELIQSSGTYDAKANDGKVAGVVLYNEGFIALTGAWGLNNDFTDKYVGGSYTNPKWHNFGRGANDSTSAATITGSLFQVEFEGVNYVPTITMMAHAKRGMLNHSTNPTYLAKSERVLPTTSSYEYREVDGQRVKQLHHSTYAETGSFEKQTYISKIGIYDKNKNLIAVAKLANPVRKTEQRDITFKLKLDF